MHSARAHHVTGLLPTCSRSVPNCHAVPNSAPPPSHPASIAPATRAPPRFCFIRQLGSAQAPMPCHVLSSSTPLAPTYLRWRSCTSDTITRRRAQAPSHSPHSGSLAPLSALLPNDSVTSDAMPFSAHPAPSFLATPRLAAGPFGRALSTWCTKTLSVAIPGPTGQGLGLGYEYRSRYWDLPRVHAPVQSLSHHGRFFHRLLSSCPSREQRAYVGTMATMSPAIVNSTSIPRWR
ncbi:LADA_0F06590g1_1 [Lachancea dasiensis]|uniref:LADA_0F06590g1_1 n=1 Tax=Lachancea dasiensis TaxID=1072105 RepID=A0A1G4JJW0_9SACH|nr:LADA_0F06590g1_1 [Lachancea dasiensis]